MKNGLTSWAVTSLQNFHLILLILFFPYKPTIIIILNYFNLLITIIVLEILFLSHNIFYFKVISVWFLTKQKSKSLKVQVQRKSQLMKKITHTLCSHCTVYFIWTSYLFLTCIYSKRLYLISVGECLTLVSSSLIHVGETVLWFVSWMSDVCFLWLVVSGFNTICHLCFVYCFWPSTYSSVQVYW